MVTDFWQVPPIGTPAIQIDINPEAMGRNYPLSAAVLGDAKTTLRQMLDQADKATSGRRTAWLSEVDRICSSWREQAQPLLSSDAIPIRPERICQELTHLMPHDAVVVVDTGNAGMWMGGMYDLTSPGQTYLRSAGHLGWAFPAGLGAKCAQPDRPVVVFTGDAGLWYHIGEIETAVRNKINTVTVVNNNRSGNQSKPAMDRLYGGSQSDFSRGLWTFTDVNLARIAEDMGAFGVRVTSPADFAPALAKALDSGRPAVVDVATDIDALPPGPVH
jgi:acetolactate synthase I/II/III large subunit